MGTALAKEALTQEGEIVDKAYVLTSEQIVTRIGNHNLHYYSFKKCLVSLLDPKGQ